MKTKIVYAVVSDEKDVYLEEHHRPIYSKGIIMMKNMTYYTRKKFMAADRAADPVHPDGLSCMFRQR